MEELIQSGRAVDIVLAVIAVEWLAIVVSAPARGRAGASLSALLALAPGVCLLLALRAALTDSAWYWIPFWVTASFPFHLADLWGRRVR